MECNSSENGYFIPLAKRKRLVVIFQKDTSLCCCLTGKRYVSSKSNGVNFPILFPFLLHTFLSNMCRNTQRKSRVPAHDWLLVFYYLVFSAFFPVLFLSFFYLILYLFSSLFAYPISPWTINTRSSSGRIYVRYNRIQSGTFRPSPLLASAW